MPTKTWYEARLKEQRQIHEAGTSDRDAVIDSLTQRAAALEDEVERLRGEREQYAKIGSELLTQDNALTAYPMVLVQQRRRIYGFDPSYHDQIVWFRSDDGEEATDEEHERLEREYWQCGPDPEMEGWTRTAYEDRWEFVQAFFTRSAAQKYLSVNGHNLRAPRIYIESAFRNDEWKDLRSKFINAAKEMAPTPPTESESGSV